MNCFYFLTIFHGFLVVATHPPSGFTVLNRYVFSPQAGEESHHFLFVGFIGAIERHHKCIVGAARIEMVFFSQRAPTDKASRK